jgi:O-antigen/teichoic acid export membrane protein
VSKKITLKQEAAYIVASNLFLQVMTAVYGFILPPLIIRTFGSETNGMVSSIKQFIACLNIVEVGIGSTAVLALYKPLEENDIAGRNEILSATRIFYKRSGLLFSGLVIVFAIIYPWLINDLADTVSAILLFLVLGLSGSAEFFLIGKYRVLLTADRKLYILNLVRIIGLIANTGIAVVLISFYNVSIITVQLVSAMFFLSRYILIKLFVENNYSSLDLYAEPNDKALSKKWDVFIHEISKLAITNSPFLVLAILSDLISVSIYSIYMTIFSSLNNLLSVFSYGLTAFFGRLLISGNIAYTKYIYNKYETVYFIVIGWGYACAYMLAIPFMQIYTKNLTDAVYVQPVLSRLFIIFEIIFLMRNPSALLIYGDGRFKQTKYGAIIEVIINITVSVLFTIKFGMIGVLFGSICSSIYRTVDMFVYAGTKIITGAIIGSLKKIILISLYYGSALFIARLIPYSGNSYREWLIYAVLVGTTLGIGSFGYLLIGFIKSSRSHK